MISAGRIRKARGGDLPAVLQTHGMRLRREGRGFASASHDSLKFFRQGGVWLYKWWSRDGEVGDGIQFLRRHRGMRFSEAVRALSGPVSVLPESGPPEADGVSETSAAWRVRAEKLIRYAVQCLFASEGADALSYLINDRGLTEETVRKHSIGWLPPKNRMPSKLVIPCRNSRGRLIRVRFRIDRPRPGECRYRVLKGSMGYSPFPLGVSPEIPVIWVESELDGILLYQEIGNEAGILAWGSAAVRLNAPVFNFLIRRIPLNLICFDNDSAGKVQTGRLLSLLPNAVSWPVPEGFGKDPGEAWPHMDFRAWVREGIKRS